MVTERMKVEALIEWGRVSQFRDKAEVLQSYLWNGSGDIPIPNSSIFL